MSDTQRPSARDHLDAEYALRDDSQSHRAELRLWLRLLTCANLIETEIRKRLREQFDTTLPRFDLLAQLHRAKDGILLGELSQRMMVSNGNVTGLVERLAREGLIERQVTATDRRAVRVRMTARGRSDFSKMAVAHRGWISDLLAGLPKSHQERLWSRLGDLKTSVRSAIAAEGGNRNGK